MSQTFSPASPAQRAFIAELVAELHLTGVDPWADDLDGLEARHLLDRLQLRKLSQELRRPVTVDLANPVAVARELKRVRQMTPRGTGGPSKRYLSSALKAADPAARRRILARQGVKVRHVAPTPAPAMNLVQERARHASLDRGPLTPYATGRYSESFGYGGAASRSLQTADARSMGAEPLIRDDSPSPAQAKFLADLQRRAGKPVMAADTKAEASEQINALKAALGWN